MDRLQLSVDLDLKYPTISNWFQGVAFPNNSTLEKIADYFNVSPAYLITDADGENAESEGAVKIPVYGRVPAGIPIEAIEDIEDWEEIPRDWMDGDTQYIALRVKGDSMYPKYMEDDVIIVRMQPVFNDGDDCVVYVDGCDATLKQCYSLPKGRIRLVPINTKYPPKTYRINEDEVSILGVVEELRRKI